MGEASHLVGIDEVGRGPLAGPLCVGACLVCRKQLKKVTRFFRGARESKQLNPLQRIYWESRMKDAARGALICFATSFVSHAVIDRDGLTKSLFCAVARCLKKLSAKPENSEIFLDGGLRAPRAYLRQTTIIRGDQTKLLIALASIAAKVRRDRYMVRLARRFPEYGFDMHKGYGTRKHCEALLEYGISPIHRVSFLRYLPLSMPRATNLKIKNKKSKLQCKI